MTTLVVITEKPSVAMDIARVLGGFARRDGYLEKDNMIISWAIGHLVELAIPEDYDPSLKKWQLDTLPILPDKFILKPRKATKKQLQVLKTLISRPDVSELINACDAGREGELIYRYLMQHLSCSKPHRRLWLQETTADAIRAAFASLRPPADDLARAAIARSQADWLVGLNATRAYSVKYGETLTIGRVQTPTLALVVKRDKDINDYKPVPYWEIEAVFDGDYKAKWFDQTQDRFSSRDAAEAVMLRLKSPGRVENIQQQEKTELPPMLFNLTDLQKEANRQFGYTAQQTLVVAQELYENHLITYPRTDSRHLTDSMATTLPGRLKALSGTELGRVVAGITCISPGKRYVDNSKVTDHTAIIITDASPADLDETQAKIYYLIARRMVAMLLPPVRYLQTTIITACQGETFISKGKTTLEPGWKMLYETETDVELPALSQGQEVAFTGAELLSKVTKPPKRFTEADLLGAMENASKQIDSAELREAMRGKGLGTPATRAAIIEKLIKTGFLERKNKTLLSTNKGRYLISIVSPELADPELTANWESKLMEIEAGDYPANQFCAEIRELTQGVVAQVKSSAAPPREKESLGTCPICGQPVVENAKAYGCSAWKEGCKFVIWKQIAGKKITRPQAKKILEKGKSDLIKGFKSKKGNTFDAYLKQDAGKIIFDFPAAACHN